MIKHFFILLVFLYSYAATAQVELAPAVINSIGEKATLGNWDIAFSVGEPVITTAYGTGVECTQGFLQNTRTDSAELALTVVDSTLPCIGRSNGSLQIKISNGLFPLQYELRSTSNSDFTPITGSTDTANVVFTNLPKGLYKFLVLSAVGNIDSLIFNLQETSTCIQPYTGVIANAPGLNGHWVIEGIDLLQNEVVIYNRWGMEVWSIDNYNNTNPEKYWNGKDEKNQPLPDGTYFYSIVIKEEGSFNKLYRGWVEVSAGQ